MGSSQREIKKFLDEILSTFNRKEFLSSDPIEFAHRYTHQEDQELIALVSALFSYGNIKSIKASLETIVEPLGEHPKSSLLSLSETQIRKLWENAYYRFYSTSDIQDLFIGLRRILLDHPNLESAFTSNKASTSIEAIDTFRNLFLKLMKRRSAGLKFMFSDPKVGVAKRWHMFLRWMVRKDEIDLGLWTSLQTQNLLVPLDTHVFKMGRKLGLTQFRNPQLKASLEMTENLKKFDPVDPVKYDFALCRMGVFKLL